MADESRKMSIAYSFELILPPEWMSTLAVFYDEIWLPYPYMINSVPSNLEKADVSLAQDMKLLSDFSRKYTKWKNGSQLLFDEKILRIVDETPIEDIPEPNYDYKSDPEFKRSGQIFSRRSGITDGDEIVKNMSMLDLILAMNSLYNKYPAPELYTLKPSQYHTEALSGFLSHSIFQLIVPQLKTLTAEQILEVRFKLENFREGFTDYVIKLTDNVESLLRSGETSELIAAQKIAERYFVTEYHQIRRQIEPLRIMSGGSILAAGGAFVLASAVQTTPALLGALAVLFGTVLKDDWQKEVAEKTNEKYAFKYISTMGSETSKRSL